MTTLNTLLKDSAYKLTQFSSAQIEALENRIIDKDIRGKITPHVVCLVRGKEIKLTPEEVVRQLYLMVLIDDLGYPVSRINIEYGVTFGRETKRADICIFDKDRPTTPYILVELKKPKLKDGKEQLKSYCNATGAPIGVWSNGDSISFYQRKDPNYFEDIPRIPSALEKLSDVLSERWTIDDLIKYDKLVNEKKSLKDLILEMEDEVLANAGVDVFEELFKLVFTKLYDEMEGGRDKKRHLVFKNYGDTETELKAKIQDLFDKARGKWEGVFTEDSKLQLTPSHLAVCVSSLEGVKLFNSNLDVVDEAFEYLINKSSKGEKGQYFTPRYVIDMCVKMLNPQEHETLIDTAAGSCGFPVHGIFHVWEQIMREEGLNKSHLFTTEKKPARCETYVQEKVFAIDFDEKAVRVGRTLNLIAGDGQTNVLHLNTLDYERWDEKTKDESWADIYGEGWKKLRKLRTVKDENRDFGFDVLMANPPFAGDIKETRILSKYELARGVSLEKIKTVTEGDKNIQDISHRTPSFSEFLHVSHETIYKMADGTYRKVKIKEQSNVGRDILFIERNLNFLKSGGRMAVVLPQGRFNNSSDKQIREYISEHCRILAVVGLHGNVFKPHIGTKTSVLFVQKWDDKLCPKVDDYPIFFATMQEHSKDNSGDKIYVAQADGAPLLDSHEHLIVKHDLFNHDGLTQDGIAEAFVEFAKKEKLSFFDSSPFDEVKYRALLEGLEIRETLLSETLENKDFRTDSDFYTKAPRINPKLKYVPIGEILLNSQYGISIEMNEENKGYPIFRMNEIHNMLCDLDVNKSADIDYIEFKKFELKNRDVLFNRTNSYEWVGRTGIFYEQENKDFIFASYLVRFVPNQEFVLPEYLTAFLNTSFGIWDIKRRARHSINQTNVNPEEVKAIQIPLLSIDFQNKLKSCFDEANQHRILSQTLYSKAENLLLDALGMADFSPSNENINIKSFKDSFVSTGRLDAEYYQPKYEDYEFYIINNSKGYKTVGNEYDLVKSSSKREKLAYNYIEISDVNVSDGAASFNRIEIEELPANAKQEVKRGDLLISKVRPNRGAVAIIDFDDTDLIVSGAFTVFREKVNSEFSNETLKVLLRTKIYRDWLLKFNIGTQYPVIRDEDILSLLIPKIESETQTKIAKLVQQSFALKAESEKLLVLAKWAVEMAIEEDEAVAMEFISRKMELFNGS